MINNDFRIYNYYVYGEDDNYGQPSLPSILQTLDDYGQPAAVEVVEEANEEESEEALETLETKMAIYLNNQSITDNIKYKDATYFGLTYDELSDNCVIDYNGTPLKVLYITKGRLNQVYMAEL